MPATEAVWKIAGDTRGTWIRGCTKTKWQCVVCLFGRFRLVIERQGFQTSEISARVLLYRTRDGDIAESEYSGKSEK